MQRNPGADAFLKRAAVLHGDAAVFEGLFPAPPNDGPTGSAVDGRGRPVPLLDNDEITLTRDGQVLGHSMASWHLPFARSLLDLLLEADSKAKADHREFAGLWYHAIAAYLFANGNFGDAKKHLQHSERVLPEDGRLLFDRGSYAEAFGLPIFQVVPDSGIPDEGKTNGEAERMYRRALDVDPSYVEARVRLARLLDRRGRHDEAQAEIDRALDARPSGAVGFYALIVAGRVSTAQGRYDAALRHYREASALYEHAQSARLGASHAGLMLADVPLAIAPLGGLGADTALADADPWLDYRLGAGREAKVLLAALWERAAQ